MLRILNESRDGRMSEAKTNGSRPKLVGFPKPKTHAEISQEMEAYRHVAFAVYNDDEPDPSGLQTTVNENHANVQLVEDGAFVDAVVFVPNSWLYPKPYQASEE
jgi:hypothetical protein